MRELGGGRAEPVLLMGDFNDPHLPRWHLRAAGCAPRLCSLRHVAASTPLTAAAIPAAALAAPVRYVDAFTALGVTPEPTFPAHPLATWDLMYPHVVLDFAMARRRTTRAPCTPTQLHRALTAAPVARRRRAACGRSRRRCCGRRREGSRRRTTGLSSRRGHRSRRTRRRRR